MAGRIEWREGEKGLTPWVVEVDGSAVPVTWAPQPGGQDAFLTSPVFETLFEGTRGNGKTDALLMDFAQHVGAGYGAEWRGILFRQTFPQLSDVIAKTLKWFPQVWPEARYNSTAHTWTWPGGEALLLRFMRDPRDYREYHGSAFPWIGWEELTNWPSLDCLKVMISTSRSSIVGMPRKVRATCNPYGVGHNAVKLRYALPVPEGDVVGPVIVDRETGLARVAVHGDVRMNRVLMHAEPEYLAKIAAAARNPSERAAWLEGSWDILAGGMFDDLFRRDVHVVESVEPASIPRRWRMFRAYDHGSAKPFSVGWYAESNGEPMTLPSGREVGHLPRDLVRFAEWYGWSGTDNEGVRLPARAIADGILEREHEWGILGRARPGPADSAIYSGSDVDPTRTVAGDMEAVGVRWVPASKGPGSRKQGWEALRGRLAAALLEYREDPALYVSEDCERWLYTVPNLPRSDRDLDDVDTDAEDHAADETRYALTTSRDEVRRRSWK